MWLYCVFLVFFVCYVGLLNFTKWLLNDKLNDKDNCISSDIILPKQTILQISLKITWFLI